MKNIVFFVESMHCGGAERSLLSLLANLDPSRYNIDLLVINKGGEFEKFIPKYIDYRSVNTSFSFSGRLKFKFYQKFLSPRHKAQIFWKAFKNSIPDYKIQYDIAIAWGQGYATYYTAEKITAKKKIAWVNTDYEKAGYKNKYDEDKYQKFDTIVGVSDFVVNKLQHFIPSEKVICIANIIDALEVKQRAEEFVTEEFDEIATNIVSVGRLAVPKAFDRAVEAAKLLKEKKHYFRWYIIGEGAERSYLESLIEKYNLQDSFILLGFRDNPYPYIKKADIYVQTSSFEGLGRTLIEASILCKPIVTTNFPTAFGILKPNETGIITEMDAVSVATGIQSVIENTELRDKIIKNLENQVDNGKEITLAKVYELFDI